MKSLSRSPSLYGSVLALAALTATPALAQSEGTKCQSLTDCDEGLTCVYGSNVAPSNPGTGVGTGTGVVTGTGSTAAAGSGVSAAPIAPLPPESTGGASGTGEDPVPEEPPVDGLVAPPPPEDGTDPPVVEDTPGVCTAVPDACTSDEQCDEGYYCSIPEVASTPVSTCLPDAPCDEVPVSDPTITVSSGTCVISPLTCSDTEPCPEATTCENGYCTYQPPECTSDDACDAGYSCTVTSTYEECSACPGTGTGMTAPGSGPTPPATGTGTSTGTSTGTAPAVAAAGSGAEAPPPDGADPIAVPPEEGGGSAPAPCTNVCTTVETRSCQPTPDACETDADCDGDWVCYDVPEAALTSMTWAGIAKTCLPLGIVAALEGSVQGSYSATLAGETTAGPGSTGAPGGMVPDAPVDESGNGVGAPLPTNMTGQAGAATSTTATGTVSAPTGTPSSGPAPGEPTTTGATPVRAARACAVGSTSAPSGSSTGASLLAALALAVGMLRRRRG